MRSQTGKKVLLHYLMVQFFLDCYQERDFSNFCVSKFELAAFQSLSSEEKIAILKKMVDGLIDSYVISLHFKNN